MSFKQVIIARNDPSAYNAIDQREQFLELGYKRTVCFNLTEIFKVLPNSPMFISQYHRDYHADRHNLDASIKFLIEEQND